MNRRLFAIFLALALTLFAFLESARAEIFLGPSLYYLDTKEEVAGTTTKATSTIVDVRIAYLSPGGFMLGGIYESDTYKSGSYQEKASIYGPSVGYVTKSFIGVASFYMAGERTYTGGTKRTEPSGPQIDLAYVYEIGSGFSLGPQLTWRSLEYAKLKSGGAEVEQKYKSSMIRPMIALSFLL